jgi:hypothetical protein
MSFECFKGLWNSLPIGTTFNSFNTEECMWKLNQIIAISLMVGFAAAFTIPGILPPTGAIFCFSLLGFCIYHFLSCVLWHLLLESLLTKCGIKENPLPYLFTAITGFFAEAILFLCKVALSIPSLLCDCCLCCGRDDDKGAYEPVDQGGDGRSVKRVTIATGDFGQGSAPPPLDRSDSFKTVVLASSGLNSRTPVVEIRKQTTAASTASSLSSLHLLANSKSPEAVISSTNPSRFAHDGSPLIAAAIKAK